MTLKGLIKSRYPNLKGKDWILRVDNETRIIIVEENLINADHAIGGRARAATAMRDKHGRFIQGRATKADKWNYAFGRRLDELSERHEEYRELELDIALDPNNTYSHPTEESERAFFQRYTRKEA